MKITRYRQQLREQWRAITPIALFAAGVILVLLGWYGAAHTNIITEQIPYLISGGLLGLGLIIVAGILSVQTSIERDNSELRRVVIRALANAAAPNGSTPDDTPAAPRILTNGHVFVVPGGRSYHAPGCPITEGKDGTEAFVLAQAAAAGYTVCKLCGD
ncbi:MAG: hypothetical protein WDA27_05985 [Actinomycetota bacterium]